MRQGPQSCPQAVYASRRCSHSECRKDPWIFSRDIWRTGARALASTARSSVSHFSVEALGLGAVETTRLDFSYRLARAFENASNLCNRFHVALRFRLVARYAKQLVRFLVIPFMGRRMIGLEGAGAFASPRRAKSTLRSQKRLKFARREIFAGHSGFGMRASTAAIAEPAD